MFLQYQPEMVISGGQTGVDIGALVGAKRAGITTGGFVPKGYRTESGPQEESLKSFSVQEMKTSSYSTRTKANIASADATIILSTDLYSDGTKLTFNTCQTLGKPFLLLDPYDNNAIQEILRFLNTHQPSVINVAGNRESKSPGIARRTAALVYEVLSSRANNPNN